MNNISTGILYREFHMEWHTVKFC